MITITINRSLRWATVSSPGTTPVTFNRHNSSSFEAQAESYAECRSLVLDLPVKRVEV